MGKGYAARWLAACTTMTGGKEFYVSNFTGYSITGWRSRDGAGSITNAAGIAIVATAAAIGHAADEATNRIGRAGSVDSHNHGREQSRHESDQR